MAALFASTWGNPIATKHVLLIHGITSSSQIWYRIAQEFASRGRFLLGSCGASPDTFLSDTGYFVTAPDLLGHGNARRSSDYTITALADELRPLFATSEGNDHPYHIVVGHSLGGLVACALLPLLKSTRSVRVVLIDPPLEQTPELVAHHKTLFGDTIRNPKTPETYLQENPNWTKEDATFTSSSIRLCEVDAVDAILDVSSFILLDMISAHEARLAKRPLVVFTSAIDNSRQRQSDRACRQPI